MDFVDNARPAPLVASFFERNNSAFLQAIAGGSRDDIRKRVPFANPAVVAGALLESIAANKFERVRDLAPRADKKAKGADGRTALELAAYLGRADMVPYLAAGLEFDAQNKRGETALMIAASEGHSKTVAVLSERSRHGMIDAEYKTALMRAAQAGHADIVPLLVGDGAANAVDNNGLTALMIAARSGSLEAVEALIPHSNVDRADRQGMTSLMHAASSASGASCAQALLAAGASSAVLNSLGSSASDIAERVGCAALARELRARAESEALRRESAKAVPREKAPRPAVAGG